MRPTLLAVALAATCHALAAGPEPVVQDTIPFDGGRYVVARSAELACVIALQGGISHAATLTFDAAIARADRGGCAKPWLLLESPGGFLADGIELGRAVRLAGLRTIMRYDCSSACALIFLGGVERVMVGSRARIGLHQAGRTYRDDKYCSSTRQTTAARDIRRYLAWVVPATAETVFDTLMRTECTAIEFVQGQHALDLGIATSLDRPDEDLFGPRQRRTEKAKRD